MNLLGIGSIIEGVGKIADDLYTSKEEELKLAIQEKAIDADLMKGQMEVNKAEAEHKSIFIAGWRPFIGWVGGIALAYQFVLYPILTWLLAILDANGISVQAPPVFDAGPLFAIVTGMLGIGGMRSFDKLKNIDTKKIGK